jgi:hypothetical protein
MVLHWQGGDHTALKLKMNTVGKHRWTVAEDTLTLVQDAGDRGFRDGPRVDIMATVP